jgi:hypothetical protein
MAGILSTYFEKEPCSIPSIQDALTHLKHAPIPDPFDPMVKHKQFTPTRRILQVEKRPLNFRSMSLIPS